MEENDTRLSSPKFMPLATAVIHFIRYTNWCRRNCCVDKINDKRPYRKKHEIFTCNDNIFLICTRLTRAKRLPIFQNISYVCVNFTAVLLALKYVVRVSAP